MVQLSVTKMNNYCPQVNCVSHPFEQHCDSEMPRAGRDPGDWIDSLFEAHL